MLDSRVEHETGGKSGSPEIGTAILPRYICPNLRYKEFIRHCVCLGGESDSVATEESPRPSHLTSLT